VDTAWREQVQGVFSRRNLLRIMLISVLLLIVSFLLGIAFVLIVTGVWNIFLRLSLYNQTLYTILIRLLGSNLDPTGYVAPPVSKRRLIFSIARSLLWLVLVVVGIWIILREGFLGQNLIYLMFPSTG
jgi:hypothetical protein